MTPATLLVKINRETVPEPSIDLMMCSQVAATSSSATKYYSLTCETRRTPWQPLKISSKQPGLSRSAAWIVRRPDL